MRQLLYGLLPSLALTAIATFSTGIAFSAETDAGDSQRPVSYWNDIRPLMQASCQGCHQPAKAKGEYILTDVKRLIAGGESDSAAVIPGQPEKSFFLRAVAEGSTSLSLARLALDFELERLCSDHTNR